MTNSINQILAKYEEYLLPLHSHITPENWEYWKKHGTTWQWESKEAEISYKHQTTGWDKAAIGKNIDEGLLSKDDANELLHLGAITLTDLTTYCEKLPYSNEEYKVMLMDSISKESVTDEEKKSILVALCSIGSPPSPEDYSSLIESKSVTTEWLIELESQLSEHLDLLEIWAGPEEELPLWESLFDWADKLGIDLKDL